MQDAAKEVAAAAHEEHEELVVAARTATFFDVAGNPTLSDPAMYRPVCHVRGSVT